MTNAKVNDRKAFHQLPMMAGMTYVVDLAYNDYAWYYTLTQQGSVFVGRITAVRLRNLDRSEVLEPRSLRYNSHYLDSYFTNWGQA